ncbi:hypothetical protein [Streptomyces sp. A5-4]|uniref:hypothetical protein n=1 Tax=Streptomyces sp. A5-4 TaxID=3384771 RepID=UPI003DA86959
MPTGDARVEFYAGDTLLGRPVAAKDRRSFRLPLDEARIDTTADLRVVAGGRRLDAAAPAARPARLAARAQPPTPLPANKVDAGVPVPYRASSGEYTLKSVRLPGCPAPVEMRATVVGPAGAPGKRPLALFLHGRHYTCFNAAGDTDGEWPCKPGGQPVPSHQGYLRAQKHLASQGYVTLSIAANGINGQDHLAEDGGGCSYPSRAPTRSCPEW